MRFFKGFGVMVMEISRGATGYMRIYSKRW